MKFILTIYKFDINGMIYIGSTWDFDTRIIHHKNYCYNENSDVYNYKIYKYIRENNIDWNDITIEYIYTHELDEKDNLLKRQIEQKYIDEFDSINNGLNTINAYITDEQKKEYHNEYRELHKEEIKLKRKNYYEKHKEKINKYLKKYNEEHKEKINEYLKKYTEDHKENKKEYYKKYYENHREKYKEYDRLKYERNREKILAQKRIYYNNNKEKKKKYQEHKKNEKMCGEIVNELINSLF